MRYVVLLRYGLRAFVTALKVERSQDGTITCWETVAPFTGTTWWTDGRFSWTADDGREHHSRRSQLKDILLPQVAYTIPGPKLITGALPAYASEIDQGATVQVSAHAVLEEPHRVSLQVILIGRGEQPYHRETVGDRRIDTNRSRGGVAAERPEPSAKL